MLTKWKDKQLFSKRVIALLLVLTFITIVPFELEAVRGSFVAWEGEMARITFDREPISTSTGRNYEHTIALGTTVFIEFIEPDGDPFVLAIGVSGQMIERDFVEVAKEHWSGVYPYRFVEWLERYEIDRWSDEDLISWNMLNERHGYIVFDIVGEFGIDSGKDVFTYDRYLMNLILRVVDYGAYTPIEEMPIPYTIYARNYARVITERSLGWHLTNSSSTVYNPIIAEMAAGFSDAIYDEKLIIQSLINHGFEWDDIIPRFNPVWRRWDDATLVIAEKQTESDERIVAIIIRGTQIFPPDISDVSANLFVSLRYHHNTYQHAGFSMSAMNIIEKLDTKFIDDDIFWGNCENTIFFITGHSYGGAVANLLAKEIGHNGVSQDRIFAYTFASPNTARASGMPHLRWVDEYSNIFNILNTSDIITEIPVPRDLFWGATRYVWYRFGRNVSFTHSVSPHSMALYLDVMQTQQTPTWHHPYVGRILANPMAVGGSPSNLIRTVRANSPINITVLDSHNNIIGTIINNIAWHDENHFGSAVLIVDDEGKFIHMPSDSNFRIVISATDDGTMEFDVADINSDTGEIESIISFENIPLKEGKEIITQFSADASATRLFVVEDNIRVSEITRDGRLVEVSTTTLRLIIDNIVYTINGISSESDVAPFIDLDYDRTMIPIYLLADIFDADIEWLEVSRTVSIAREGVNVILQTDTPLQGGMGQARVMNNRTFVPARYISEMFGASVRWDGNARAVYIEK